MLIYISLLRLPVLKSFGLRFSALLSFSIAFITVGLGQTSQHKFSFSIQNGTFADLVEYVEKGSEYRFYYDANHINYFSVEINVENETLHTILQNVLSDRNLHFYIDIDKCVFITPSPLFVIDGVSSTVVNTTIDSVSLAPSFLRDNIQAATDSMIAIENRVFEIGNPKDRSAKRTRTLRGYVRSRENGLPISMATVRVRDQHIQTQTDRFGFYSINLPNERSVVSISSVGHRTTSRQVVAYTDGQLDITLEDQVYALSEIIVSAERGNNVSRMQMGLEKINISAIKQTPMALGEVDVAKVILTLPGVQTVGEAASGFNVRGGATDQNLILFNDATIYNPNHFFGFFSAFSPEAVSTVELYKSSIPAKFGGRLSSVMDVAGRGGNEKKISGAGGLGLVTSRLSLDGPIGDKTTFFVGGRSTYSDWLLNVIPDDNYKNSDASFYDVSLVLEHKANERNTFFLTGYTSNNRFSLNNDTAYRYSNANINLKWKRTLRSNVYGAFTAGVDTYGFGVNSSKNPVNAYDMGYRIAQTFVKADITHNATEKHRFNYGINSMLYKLSPGFMHPQGTESLVVSRTMESEQALETALYFSDEYQYNENLTLDLGVRYSIYNYLGPRHVNIYAPGIPLSESTMAGTRQYGSGDFIRTYHGPEFRLSARYLLGTTSSLKASYNSLRQYIHMLSNTTAITPTDTWKLSDTHIKPQLGDQFSLGYYKNIAADRIETSVEVYYKRMKDFLDYKSGAQLFMNDMIETDVIGTRARAYGAEFMLKKISGRLNGWISYTYSRVEQRTEGVDEADLINDGNYYPSNHDKPHDVTLVGNYRISHRFSVSLNSTYSTGRPITLPIARYYYAGSERVYYSQRNAYRIPDFFRMDVSLNIEGNHKIKKLAHSSWTVGVYNVTGRRNPFSVYYTSEGGELRGYRLSIFGNQIPFLTYNFRF